MFFCASPTHPFKAFFTEAREKAEEFLDEDQALYVLGELYENGYGVSKDTEKAKTYYNKAAQMGHKVAEKKLQGNPSQWEDEYSK